MERIDNNIIINNLLSNAKSAIFGAVELHNKPIFPNRYEVSIILTINAWELLMKAYILKEYPEKGIFEDDGQTTLPFEKCVSFISHQIGKDFLLIQESVNKLYEYRCNIIHYYGEGIEKILYSILRPNILFFSDFLHKKFGVDLASEANLIILPLGFSPTVTPIDFLSKKSVSDNEHVRSLIASIVKSVQKLHEEGVEDGLLCNYGMFLEKENNIKNADLVIAFTKNKEEATLTLTKVTQIGGFTSDKNAPKVQIDEETIWSIYNINHAGFIKAIKEKVSSFKTTNENLKIIAKEIKSDPDCYRERLLDPKNPNGIKKGFYRKEAINKAVELFRK